MQNYNLVSRFLTSLFIIFCPLSNGWAVPITYDENTHGDLISGVTLDQITNIGVFDIGINTVSGNFATIVPGTTAFDADAFLFEVPDGLNLTSVIINYTNVTGLTQVTMKIREVKDIPNMIIGDVDSEFINISMLGFPISYSPVSAFETFLPISAGIYSILTPASFGGDGSDVNMDYIYQFVVSPIPEPSITLLIGSGLLGLIGISRRKKAA